MKRPSLLFVLLFFVLGCGGVQPHTVARIENGRSVESQVVPAAQYEAFVRAEIYANRGQWTEARAQYELALVNGESDRLLRRRYADALCHTEPERAARFAENEMRTDGVIAAEVCASQRVVSRSAGVSESRSPAERVPSESNSDAALETQFLFGPLMTDAARAEYERRFAAAHESR